MIGVTVVVATRDQYPNPRNAMPMPTAVLISSDTRSMTDKVMKLGGPESIVGLSVVVHEKADDLKTQPTGDSGARVACGVVGVAKP
jgi:Cu/Zn superoxide dismutase